MFLVDFRVFGNAWVLWCFLCLLVYDTSCFEYAHMTISEFQNSNFRPLKKEPSGSQIWILKFKNGRMAPTHRNYTQNNLYHTQASTGNTGNTGNIAKNTKIPHIRPKTSKTAFLTVKKEPLGSQIWISKFKNGCMCLQCTETILKTTYIIHKQA